MRDAWTSADPYDRYIGRWSRALAPEFLAWVGIPADSRVLEVGCGTGALSESVLASRPRSFAGFDLAPAYVEAARLRLGAPDATFEVADARSLPVPDASFDACVSGLVLNFVPEPSAMVREMRRALAPRGVAAVYVWDYAGRMEMLRRFWDAARRLDAGATKLDEAVRFPVCDPRALEQLFASGGFGAVETRAIDAPTTFADFDDYWAPFLGGQGPAPSYVASLDPKRRETLREELRRSLAPDPDGKIRLVARAWAVKARA